MQCVPALSGTPGDDHSTLDGAVAHFDSSFRVCGRNAYMLWCTCVEEEIWKPRYVRSSKLGPRSVRKEASATRQVHQPLHCIIDDQVAQHPFWHHHGENI